MKFVKFHKSIRHMRGKRSKKISFLLENSCLICYKSPKKLKYVRKHNIQGMLLGEKTLESIRFFVARFCTKFKLSDSKVTFRIKTTRTVVARSAQIPMGGGKSSVAGYVVPVKPGTMIFEFSMPREFARMLTKKIGYMLPFFFSYHWNEKC